jgi:hypothetical protein
MRRVGTAGLLAVGVALLGAAPGQAQELPGGRYVGEYEGGTVRIAVSPSGTRLAEFEVTNDQGEICALGPSTPFRPPAAAGLPIENHAFAGALSPSLWIGGSFTAPGVASGSFDLSSVGGGRFGGRAQLPASCPSEPMSWSALGDATAPSLLTNIRTTQSRSLKTVTLRVSCPGEPCTVLAQGVVTITAPGVKTRSSLLSAAASGVSGKTALQLVIPLGPHHEIKRLGSKGTVIVKVRVTAGDSFGNVSGARDAITLR